MSSPSASKMTVLGIVGSNLCFRIVPILSGSRLGQITHTGIAVSS